MEEQISKNYDTGEYFSIDIKKIILALWYRKTIMLKVFLSIVLFFIIITFFLKKEWVVSADLYINKTNNTNYSEINPYAIEELGIGIIQNKNPLADEIELIKSPLVLEDVIKENDLKYKKFLGFIPTKKSDKYLTVDSFLKKKKATFENKNGTSILSISYKNKDKKLAYDVVNSIIKNYIELHQEINSEKSKSDKQIIETEYKRAKENLNKKVHSANGLPTASLSGTGNLAAMSAFSRSAQNAMATLKEQYMAGEKTRVEISEEATKVTQLASKLEWAKLVEEMSDSSKVLVIKEPRILEDWEYSSPNLFINILVGVVMGLILSLVAVVYKEISDKKLTYSALGNNVIYNLEKEFNKISATLYTNTNKMKVVILFEELPINMIERFKQFDNLIFVKADVSKEFTQTISYIDYVITIVGINKTDKENYLLIKNIIEETNKKILYECIV